jgi:hypothetical protein
MPRRINYRRRRAPRMQGEGFFSSLWDGVKSVHNFVKDNKLISKGLGAVNPKWGQVASLVGYGRRRPRNYRPRQRGGSAIQI